MTTLHHPEVVRTLTLGEPPVLSLLMTDSSGQSLVQHFLATTIRPAVQELVQGHMEKGVRIFVGGMMGDSTAFARLPASARKIMMDNARELKTEFTNKSQFPGFSCDDAKKITVPTLLVVGDRSPQFLREATNRLEQCLPNKERRMLPNSSHGLEFDNPQAFNEAVLSFISTRRSDVKH